MEISFLSRGTFFDLPLVRTGGIQYVIAKFDSSFNRIKSDYLSSYPGSNKLDGAQDFFTAILRLGDGSYIVAHETPHAVDGQMPSGNDIFIYKLQEDSLYSSFRR